jgi:ankyrin repeat protein
MSATPSFWSAFVNPARATEAVHWIKRHPIETRQARGEYGETALHWGALSSLSLMTDLIDLGIPMDAADQSGKTPQDWQNDRLFAICIARTRDLNEGGRLRVRQESEAMIQALWRMGGRPGIASPLDPAQVWVRAGLWNLLDMRADLRDIRWTGMGDRGESMLHGWVQAPETAEKHRRLAAIIKSGHCAVDELDRSGKTPLMYAVTSWVERPAWGRILAPAIVALRSFGANVDQIDDEGLSPRQGVIAATALDTASQNALRQAMGMAETEGFLIKA